MRVLHIVTLVSPQASYGGPLRVAINQCQELQRRGHDVEIVAGFIGQDAPPDLEGVPTRLFRARQVIPRAGFSGLIAAGMRRYLDHQASRVDIMHVHAGRDLVSMDAMRVACRSQTPFVAQTHGMVGKDLRPKARLLDALLVRRLLRQAAHTLVLTLKEEEEISELLGHKADRTIRLPNGVRLPEPTLPDRRPLLDVLFCARLHPRKRPEIFVRAAAMLLRQGHQASFSLVGPDEGSLGTVRDLIDSLNLRESVRYEGGLPYDGVMRRMQEASVYVLPSVDEPFPMSLLEAMSLGIPSVCTDSCGIADLLRSTNGAVVVGEGVEDIAGAIAGLISDETWRLRQGQHGREVIGTYFSIEAVVDRLEELYQSVIATRQDPRRA